MVGIYLQRLCCTHGHLYVTYSRAQNFQSIKVKVVPTTEQGSIDRKTYTPNVVLNFTQLQVITL